jgi:biotin operon repressor
MGGFMGSAGNLPGGEQTPIDPEAQKKLWLQKGFLRKVHTAMDALFYITLGMGLYEAGVIVWDLFTMMPWFTKLIGMTAPNVRYATPELSNIYLGLLLGYAGGKEFRNWTKYRNIDLATVSVEELEERDELFSRGTIIMFSWLILLCLCKIVKDMYPLERLPYEVFRVAMQSLGVWTGTQAFSSARKSSLKRKVKEAGIKAQARQEPVAALAAAELNEQVEKARLNEQHREMLITYLKKTRWIASEEITEMTGLDRHQLHRLIGGLEKNGRIVGDGDNKHRRYRLNDNEAPPEQPQTPPDPKAPQG